MAKEMVINNGLSHVRIEDVEVEVTFANEDGETVSAGSDPANTNTLFFIRADSTGIKHTSLGYPIFSR